MPVSDDILIEAESFADRGGWVMDQQSIEVMGSAYLLAHGLGQPVADAVTRVRFPHAGHYRIFVRTRDWAGPSGPGRFSLVASGKCLPQVFGSDSNGQWHWQPGGVIDVPAGEVALALRDLTGFEARCDAIVFSRDGIEPPDDVAQLARYRRERLEIAKEPTDLGAYELVVVGGGYAGVCAAITAARLGLKVALIQNRAVLGGNASSEVRVGPIGKLTDTRFPANADIVKELQASSGAIESSGGFRARPNDRHVERCVLAERNIHLLMETHLAQVEKSGDEITAIIVRDLKTSKEFRLRGTLFADCTGDATLGVMAGAEWRMGREGAGETGEALAPLVADSMLLGCTNLWAAKLTAELSEFPNCPWAIPLTEESRDISPPKWPAKLEGYAFIGGWNWESGFGKDMCAQVEEIRDHNLRAMYGMWDFLKNRASDREKYACAQLEWAAFIAGKRESRRLIGDLILCQQDITKPVAYEDGCVMASWYFDAHFPHPDNQKHYPGQAFRSLAYDDPAFEQLRGEVRGSYTAIEPYWIPYRCFYSRSVSNLFMAGRNISTTHVGLLPVRVMNTTGMMGTVIGRAAALCTRRKCLARGVYVHHLVELKQLLADGHW